MTATATGPLALGDRMVSRDGKEATVVKLELRGGLGGALWEHWALLARGGHGRRWVQVELPDTPAGDESDVVALVGQRLAMGRAQYGPLQVDADPRDWTQEALEEMLDGCVYLAGALIQHRRSDAPGDDP